MELTIPYAGHFGIERFSDTKDPSVPTDARPIVPYVFLNKT